MTGKKKNSKKGKAGKPAKGKTAPVPSQKGFPTGKVVSTGLGRPQRSVRMPHVHATCSITDPFCVHARGASRPDGGPPTIPFQIRALTSINAYGTGGTCRYTFIPGVLYHYANAVPTAVWTNAGVWSTAGGAAFVNTNAKELRIVSFGVILRSSMSATNAKGMVILGVDPAPAISGTYEIGSMQTQESQLIPLAAGTEHAWVSKPLGPSAHNFRALSDYPATKSDFDWTSLTVEVTGGDTTNNIPYMTAEIVMNVELTLNSGQSSTLAMLQKTPAAPNRVVTAAAERVHVNTSSFIQGGISTAVKTMEGYAKTALDEVLADGMALLFG